MKFPAAKIALALLPGIAAAQSGSVTTVFDGAILDDGCMFDVIALRSLVIKEIDAHFDPGPVTVEVYYREGGFCGAQTNPGLWTLAGSTNVVGAGFGVPTPIPLTLDIVIPAGKVFGIYVTGTGNQAQCRTTDSLGQIFTQGLEIAVFEGEQTVYPFANGISNRLFNGTVHYELTSLAATPDELSIASGGVQDMGLSPGIAYKGLPYLLVGTTSGTSPGFQLGTLILPIGVDSYTLHTVNNPNTPPLSGSFGTFDEAGLATAQFTLPTGLPPMFAGLTLHHAYAVFQLLPGLLDVPFVSEAAPLTLLP